MRIPPRPPSRLACAAALCLALPAAAQTLPEPLSPFVSDFADLLDPATEARLTDILVAARQDPGTEIAVVVVDTRRDWGFHVSTESFATDLFNAWGIGDAERDDGILLLVAVDDREMRLELGSGYGAAWDEAAEWIVHRRVLPAFRQEDYAGGILAGTEAAIDRIARPFREGRPPPEPGLGDHLAEWGPLYAFIAALGGFFALGGYVMWKTRPTCAACGRRSLARSARILREATPAQPGESEETLTCRRCGHVTVQLSPIVWMSEEERRAKEEAERSRSSSSDFGGGSSSGGGASGRW